MQGYNQGMGIQGYNQGMGMQGYQQGMGMQGYQQGMGMQGYQQGMDMQGMNGPGGLSSQSMGDLRKRPESFYSGDGMRMSSGIDPYGYNQGQGFGDCGSMRFSNFGSRPELNRDTKFHRTATIGTGFDPCSKHVLLGYTGKGKSKSKEKKKEKSKDKKEKSKDKKEKSKDKKKDSGKKLDYTNNELYGGLLKSSYDREWGNQIKNGGTLIVKPLNAKLLIDEEMLGTMDPYVRVKVGNNVKSTNWDEGGGKNPTWKDSLPFENITAQDSLISLDVFDHDNVSSDDFLGNVTIDIKQILEKKSVKSGYDLIRDGKVTGEIYVRFDFTKGGSQSGNFNRPNEISVQGSKPNFNKNKGTLDIKAISANLKYDHDWFGKQDPYCIITIGANKQKTNVAVSQGKSPKWEESLTFDVRGERSIQVEVWDYDSLKWDELIGSCVVNISEIETKMGHVNEFR